MHILVGSAFAVYEVNPDTELVDQQPIYYTENYEPGMFADGRSTFAIGTYGSYSAYNWKPVVSYLYQNGSETELGYKQLGTSTPTVTTNSNSVSAAYLNSIGISSTDIDFRLGQIDGYFDFQSSALNYTQTSAQADTFVLNGALSFVLSSYWDIRGGASTYRYAAVDPVGVQLLVDGKPYGDVFPISSYSSPYTAAFSTAAPTTATVQFNNVKIYGVTATPELIGFRVYVGSNYSGGSYSYGNASGLIINYTNSFSWSSQPTIQFVRESTSSDQDLSNLGQLLQGGLFNGNGVPLLDVVNSFLEDGLFDSNGTSLLNSIFSSLFLQSSSGWYYLAGSGVVGVSTNPISITNFISEGFLGLRSILLSQFQTPEQSTLLSSNGQALSYDAPFSFERLVRNGFLGLRSLMVDSNGTSFLKSINSTISSIYSNSNSLLTYLTQSSSSGIPFLSSSGVQSSTTSVLSIANIVRQGFLGFSQNIKDFNSYLEDSSFSWQSYNLDTHELDSVQTLTGQNQLFQTAFQSIEENLGRLTYVFASDDELELRDEADPGVASFKDAFGGGAKAKDIGQMKNTFNDVETMFDTGFSINDFFDSLGSDDSWLSWFSAETAYALDSTPAVMTVGDEDPYNHQAYQDHLAAVEAIRNRGGAEE